MLHILWHFSWKLKIFRSHNLSQTYLAMNGTDFSVGGNQNLDACPSDPCPKNEKKNNIIIPIVASIGGVLVIVTIAAITFWIIKSRKKPQGKNVVSVVDKSETNSQFGNSLEVRRQQFTYSEVVKMTNNFTRVLGKGGFGEVYYGVIDDIQVAVKMLSVSSSQGYRQFQAEACYPKSIISILSLLIR